MDEKMEIRLVNPTEDGFLQKIDWNKAELEENVRSIVAAYQGFLRLSGKPPAVSQILPPNDTRNF